MNGDENPFIGTATRKCLVKKYEAVRIKPFAGGWPTSVGKSLAIRSALAKLERAHGLLKREP
ncbi:hypothetical protein AKJ09_08181 [Labilithrix luteola]|uniref:Uncharacterized protein n=1 Tax=Labilithrix luteola TaxID=1391654 RepID=A0A0K1Q709_9BACT|nr:hypothetical protein [Labilithrix luteola]AKV01518.1 hypothetical protein AKJ09_08181 [Labilithrix luteola]